MMEASIISIILPIYKNRAFIDEAIASIHGFNDYPYEVIAVVRDDGDGMYDYIKSNYESCRFRIVKQFDIGIANAVNAGLESARGKYIAFQDADDVSSIGRFEIEMEILENNPNVEMVFSKANTINELGRKVSTFGGINKGGVINQNQCFYELFVHGNFIPNPSVMMKRRHILDNRLFDEKIKFCNDYLHHLLLSMEWDIFQIDEPLVNIRRFTGHSNATSNLIENIYSLEYIIHTVGEIGQKKGLVNEVDSRIAKSNMYLFSAFHFIQQKQINKSLEYIFKSIQSMNSPFDDLNFRINKIFRVLSIIHND